MIRLLHTVAAGRTLGQRSSEKVVRAHQPRSSLAVASASRADGGRRRNEHGLLLLPAGADGADELRADRQLLAVVLTRASVMLSAGVGEQV
mmetsp:Transcript_3526/g.6747  ORF Transcript_3526/g.6747 Transcript_3526/m.6747 type:complete len:91 (+) Transcript_3526:412-684(+)